MKAYGYQREDAYERGEDGPDDQPLDLREVTLIADSSSLRQIAEFLSHCADLIDKHGSKFGHQHLRDNIPSWKDGESDLIVVRKQKQKKLSNKAGSVGRDQKASQDGYTAAKP